MGWRFNAEHWCLRLACLSWARPFPDWPIRKRAIKENGVPRAKVGRTSPSFPLRGMPEGRCFKSPLEGGFRGMFGLAKTGGHGGAAPTRILVCSVVPSVLPQWPPWFKRRFFISFLCAPVPLCEDSGDFHAKPRRREEEGEILTRSHGGTGKEGTTEHTEHTEGK